MFFRGFFSYAHADSETDRDIFRAMSQELEARVQQHLVNAQFSIWKDTRNLRLADVWEREIEDGVKGSNIFIAIVSPSWINSNTCRREYNTFLGIEKDDGAIPSIVSIVIRDLDSQLKYFHEGQLEVYSDIKSRQYTHVHIMEIGKMGSAERSGLDRQNCRRYRRNHRDEKDAWAIRGKI